MMKSTMIGGQICLKKELQTFLWSSRKENILACTAYAILSSAERSTNVRNKTDKQFIVQMPYDLIAFLISRLNDFLINIWKSEVAWFDVLVFRSTIHDFSGSL